MCTDREDNSKKPKNVTAETPVQLEEGTVLICCDDDLVPRAQYNSIIAKKRLGPVDCDNSRVLGATYSEAANLVGTVLQCSAEIGDDKLVCIFDQNMDYSEGNVKGTEVVAELRSRGFKGVIFIRSSDDDSDSKKEYSKAGASGFLSKHMPVSEMIAGLQAQYQRLQLPGAR